MDELRDDRITLFATELPEGVYTYTYYARATTYSSFIMPPTYAEEMYSPDVFGRTATMRVNVSDLK
jgi:alpha-2-macroglobulin